MVMLDEETDLNSTTILTGIPNSSREERRRTGRYIAAGTAIFLCLLGLYEVLARGIPEYAALFLPAVIMFVYVLWILYASKRSLRKKAKLEELLTRSSSNSTSNLKLDEIKIVQDPPKIPDVIKQVDPPKATKNFDKEHVFCRTYSVA